MNSPQRLKLASTSPRRREILETLGIDFDLVPVEVDESRLAGESAETMVLRLARAKAEAASGDAVVLAADTMVVLGDQVLGKPVDADDAVTMLLSLSGQVHTVMTGVAVQSASGTEAVLSSTQVHFREIRRDEAYRYWQSGEPADKAGAYGIQGLGGMFVTRIDGSYSGVMGLPVYETVELLKSAGIELLLNKT